MVEMKSYKITCLNCKGSNVAMIINKDGDQVIDLNHDHRRHPDNIHIISGRLRGDLQFGWECMCGNDSRLARQEFPAIRELVINGSEDAIKKITNSLKREDKKKFKMEEV